MSKDNPNYISATKIFESLHPVIQNLLISAQGKYGENKKSSYRKAKAIELLMPTQTKANFDYVKSVIMFNKDYVNGLKKLEEDLVSKYSVQLGFTNVVKVEVDINKYNELLTELLPLNTQSSMFDDDEDDEDDEDENNNEIDLQTELNSLELSDDIDQI